MAIRVPPDYGLVAVALRLPKRFSRADGALLDDPRRFNPVRRDPDRFVAKWVPPIRPEAWQGA